MRLAAADTDVRSRQDVDCLRDTSKIKCPPVNARTHAKESIDQSRARAQQHHDWFDQTREAHLCTDTAIARVSAVQEAQRAVQRSGRNMRQAQIPCQHFSQFRRRIEKIDVATRTPKQFPVNPVGDGPRVGNRNECGAFSFEDTADLLQCRLEMNEVFQTVIQDDRIKGPRSERQVHRIRLNENARCGAGPVEINANGQKSVVAGREASVPASEVQNARIAMKVLQDFVQTVPSEERTAIIPRPSRQRLPVSR